MVRKVWVRKDGGNGYAMRALTSHGITAMGPAAL